MGGELPAEAKQSEPTNYEPTYEPPREIYLTVRQEAPPQPEQEEEQYQEQTPAGGIPVYDSYYPSYYPYSPYSNSHFLRRHCCNNFNHINSNSPFQFSPNGQANWHFDAGYSTKPRVSPPPRPQTPVPGSSSGVRRIRN
jgi:hypothetical protein